MQTAQWQLELLAPRTRHSLEVHAADDVSIPFTVLAGKKPRPAALILGGVHGDEYEGPAAILDLMAAIDPANLDGSVIFVPIANPRAFAAASRLHPVDGGDLNRSFPGEAAGGPTARLADALVKEFVIHADCIFSLHGWGKEALVHPYVEYPAGNSAAASISREAAIACGFPCVYPYAWPAGVLGNFALRQGIPILEGEVGGMATITPQGQKLYRDTILRFLAHFAIMKAANSETSKPDCILGHHEIRASHSGLFQSSLTLGAPISAGDTLGVIRGLDGRVQTTLQAQHTGMVGVMRMLSSVMAGDLLFHLFVLGQA